LIVTAVTAVHQPQSGPDGGIVALVAFLPRSTRGDETPKSGDRDRSSGRVFQTPKEITGSRVIGIDPAVPEVAYQESAAEGAEAEGRDRETPRRIELALRDQMVNEITLEVVDVDVARARVRHVIMLVRVLRRVRDIEMSVNVGDVERTESARYVRIR